MLMRLGLGLILSSLLLAVGGGAQTPTDAPPVWTIEIIKAKPGKFGPTLGYLDGYWMRVRSEAKHQGAVLDFHRIAEKDTANTDGTIILLTEFRNQATCDGREKLFASILKRLPDSPSGVVMPPYKQEDLYDTVSSRVLEDYSDTNSVRIRLLAKQ
jgi:hypothetical protein